MFYDSLPLKRVTKIGRISLGTSKKVCLTNVFQHAICDACDSCNAIHFSLFTVTSMDNIHKITIIRYSETLNKMKVGAED